MSNIKDYSVSKVKTFQGHDGFGYNAALLKNGKKIAFVVDLADGGEANIRWEEGCLEEKQVLQELLKTLPSIELDGLLISYNLDIFVEELVHRYEENKKLRVLCKRKTLYRVAGDERGSWRTLTIPYSEKAKGYLTAKYNNIAEIANERF